MLTASMEKKSLEGVMKVIQDLGFNARKEIRIAISATAKKVKIASARKLRTEINAPVKVLKKVVRVEKQTDPDWLAATVVMIAGHKIPLKYLGARQTKGGTAYKINAQNKGRLPNAFVVAKYEKRVYQRAGKQRGPLSQQKGPAPGEVYQSAGVAQVAVKVASEELSKQVADRVRFLTLKAQGKLKGKQP